MRRVEGEKWRERVEKAAGDEPVFIPGQGRAGRHHTGRGGR